MTDSVAKVLRVTRKVHGVIGGAAPVPPEANYNYSLGVIALGSRGVQALTAWITEGGGTPKFFATANNLIAEDGAVEPLITGLINVSALLANVAAGAIGTSPEGPVGGLLGVYGPFDQPIPADAT